MTFSIAARCTQTGAFGIGITTGSICVGARCPFVKAGAGAVLTQHSTDPRLGLRGIELLSQGKSAAEIMADLRRDRDTIAWRQLAVIDREGRTAHFTGDKNGLARGGAEGPNCVAIGNILKNDGIPKAMIDGFMEKPAAHLADRLLRALAAGLDAGGEINPLRSATLLVAEKFDFPEINLRVDWHEEPIAKLARTWRIYQTKMAGVLQRVIDPANAPSG